MPLNIMLNGQISLPLFILIPVVNFIKPSCNRSHFSCFEMFWYFYQEAETTICVFKIYSNAQQICSVRNHDDKANCISTPTMKKLKVAYNNSLRRFMFLQWRNTAPEMFVNLGIHIFV